MNELPFYIPLVFVLTTFLAMYIFWRAAGYSKAVLFVLLSVLILEGLVGLTGFFTHTEGLPPRLAFLLVPVLIFIVVLFLTRKGRSFIDSLDLKTLTFIHMLRMPVELVLFWLFLQKVMPQLMTFEGRNLDIISGLTAPVIYYFGFVKRKLGPKVLMTWNVVCLSILAFTVTNAILSVPSPFQQLAFDQPTIAVLYFPFVWLPGMLVPLVYFSHLVAIRRYWNELQEEKPVLVPAH